MTKGLLVCIALMLATGLAAPSSMVDAGDPEATRFERAWLQIDEPVASGAAGRTWVWGPAPVTGILEEPDELAPVGIGPVQYFEKGRMQFAAATDAAGASDAPRSGRLVAEMLAGDAQIATFRYAQLEPAMPPVAGDGATPEAVSYAVFAGFRTAEPFGENAMLDTLLAADGSASSEATLQAHGVTAGPLVETTNHRVASVFWEFLNSSGLQWGDDGLVQGPLFSEPLALTGNPLTEAYWIEASVAGERQPVLVQCFESRCMTYTPENPEGWRVEFNNAGTHYLEWRAAQEDGQEPEPPTGEQPDLPVATFDTGASEDPRMTLEVAATPETRQCGLMHRTELPADTGMLFVFEEDALGGFWNCNTFIALTLAWIDASGAIIGFSDMEPQTTDVPQDVSSLYPPGPYRYVIEANQGWFAAHGVEVGDRVDLAAALAAGDTGTAVLCRELGLDCN